MVATVSSALNVGPYSNHRSRSDDTAVELSRNLANNNLARSGSSSITNIIFDTNAVNPTLGDELLQTIREQPSCSICLEDFNSCVENCHNIVRLNCGHIFHDACINEWLKQNPSCPIDRSQVAFCSRDEKPENEAFIESPQLTTEIDEFLNEFERMSFDRQVN